MGPVLGFEGEGVGGGRRRPGRQVISLHALRAALGGRGQLAVTVGPAAFTDDTHSKVAFIQFPQGAQVLGADAVLFGELLLPCRTMTRSWLLDGGSLLVQLIFLHMRCVGAVLTVLLIIWVLQGHPPPREEVKIQEGSLGAESTHGSCMRSDGEG